MLLLLLLLLLLASMYIITATGCEPLSCCCVLPMHGWLLLFTMCLILLVLHLLLYLLHMLLYLLLLLLLLLYLLLLQLNSMNLVLSSSCCCWRVFTQHRPEHHHVMGICATMLAQVSC
jgi:hypothetical protein